MSKIFNSKTLAIALSVVMVVCAFCATLSVSADDANLLAGLGYTYTMNAFQAGGEDADATLLTDGAFRGDGTNAYNGTSGVNGVTVEMAGTYANNIIEFAFDDATSIGTIVIRNARTFFQNNGVNRHTNVSAVKVTTDGLNYTDATFEAEYVAVADSPLYAVEQGGDEFPQYFDIFVTVTGADDAMGLSVTLTTERADGSYGYIVQLDEIEAYAPGVEAPVRGGETDTSVDSDESVESVDSVDSVESVESVESVDDVVIAETTYTVTITENEDGTYTVTATIPADIESGKIIVAVSEDLELVAGSLKADASGSTLNENYNRDGVSGATNSFANSTAYAEGTVVFEANYTAVEGATIDASDVTVPVWNLSSAGTRVGTEADGDVAKVFVPFEVEEPSVDSVESVESVESVDSVDSEESVESSEDSVVEESSKVDDNTTGTGDAGIAVFAVLAVLSGAAVVVLKKRA